MKKLLFKLELYIDYKIETLLHTEPTFLNKVLFNLLVKANKVITK